MRPSRFSSCSTRAVGLLLTAAWIDERRVLRDAERAAQGLSPFLMLSRAGRRVSYLFMESTESITAATVSVCTSGCPTPRTRDDCFP